MSITTTTHLNFRGDARAALEFYQAVFGGEITLVTYQDAHNVQDPSEATQIMWGQVQGDNGIHVMAYDVPVRMPYEQGVNSVFVSVRGKNTEEITSYWRASPRARASSTASHRPTGRPSTACSRTVSAWSGCSTSSPTPPPPDKKAGAGCTRQLVPATLPQAAMSTSLGGNVSVHQV
jgi:PhnB protein